MSNKSQYLFTLVPVVDEDTMTVRFEVDSFLENYLYDRDEYFSYQELKAMEEFGFLDDVTTKMKLEYETLSRSIEGIQTRMRFNPDTKGIYAVIVDRGTELDPDTVQALIDSKEPDELKRFLEAAKI